MAADVVSLRALTSVCVHLAHGAGGIIRGVAGPGRPPGDLLVRVKEDDTPQTVADRRSQEHIVSGIRAHFPLIAVVGEEGDEHSSQGIPPQARVDLLDACWTDDVLLPASSISVCACGGARGLRPHCPHVCLDSRHTPTRADHFCAVGRG